MKENNNFLNCSHIIQTVMLVLIVGIFGNIQCLNAQTRHYSFDFRDKTLQEAIQTIEAQSHYAFLFAEKASQVLNQKLKIRIENADINSVLSQVFQTIPLSYKIVGQQILLTPKVAPVSQATLYSIQGSVKDNKGEILPGVSIVLKLYPSLGTTTNMEGKFILQVPENNDALVVSFIGMTTQEVKLQKGVSVYNIVLQPSNTELSEVVAMGYFSRKKESFTGSAATYKSEDLKMVGKQNILQSLKTLDPAFNIMENRDYGSDPNRLPDIEVRGKSSVVGLKQQFGSDPNQPLFILDGFETTLQAIMDLNMERVESITLLKDAASTAIYGSRAANGVVVIETKRPQPGQLRLSYTGDFMVSMPDLSDYNLMNAEEKLEFERLAGVYKVLPHVTDPLYQVELDQIYNQRMARIRSGVNTYWLHDPVRTGFTHKHNFYVDGGDEAMRYGFGLTYNGTTGVMKESFRDVFSGNLDLLYRKGKLSFNNKLTIDYNKFGNPTVDFSVFAAANPYYLKRDEDGVAGLYLERRSATNTAMRDVYNPLYDAGLNNSNGGSYIGIRDNFQMEWDAVDKLKVRARFGVNKSIQSTEEFVSPFHSSFLTTTDVAKKGSYSKTTSNTYSYDGDLTLRYGNVFAEKHQLNVVAGWSFSDVTIENDGYKAMGFAGDENRNPAFSNQYKENSKPDFGQNQSRATSFFGNLGYAFNDRYLLDANLRMDGSSVFGSNRMFTTTWSAGLAWNMHQETFLKDVQMINLLKVRASVGNPGNQNFSGYNSFTTYMYNTSLNNVFGAGAAIYQFGNPDLLWQKTMDLNVGADIALWRNRLKVNVDLYRKKTDPLLVVATVASSVGSTSFTTNLGEQLTKGVNASIAFSPVYRLEDNINWTVTANVRAQRAEYSDIGNKLDHMNNAAQGSSLTRYYDGGSPTAIWAVRSAGIDPMTGKEIFIKKSGQYTFEHDYTDEVVVGNTEPKLEGVIGTALYYKGLSVSAYFRYRIGADVFNSALYEKVENITRSNWTKNLDRRALTDRWQKPGDKAQFKNIALEDADHIDPMSSRFVQRENTLSGESFSVGYEFMDEQWMKVFGLSSFTLKAYMNDIFRVSTIKAERGIQYPFARSVSFSISATF